MQLAPQVRADSRILLDIMDYNDEDVEYANFAMDLWTNFAKYGYVAWSSSFYCL